MNVRENFSLAASRSVALRLHRPRRRDASWPSEGVARFASRRVRSTQIAGRLSGGNQQKIVLGKWLANQPKLLILDEPTRGIDVGAKAEIHRLMGELAAQGLAILMISSELPEVLGMSDRVLVMREGRLVAEFARAEATPEAVGAAMMGSSGASRERRRERAGGCTPRPGASRALARASPRRRRCWPSRSSASRSSSASYNPRFLATRNLSDILLGNAYIAVAAIGMSMVIVSGNIDISVGALIGVLATISGSLAVARRADHRRLARAARRRHPRHGAARRGHRLSPHSRRSWLRSACCRS